MSPPVEYAYATCRGFRSAADAVKVALKAPISVCPPPNEGCSACASGLYFAAMTPFDCWGRPSWMDLSPARRSGRAGLFSCRRPKQATTKIFSSRSMSAPVRQGCAPNRDYTERKKGRAQDISIACPGGHCAKEREGGKQSKVARLHVHFCSRLKGAATGLPLPVRELMALSRAVHETPRKQEGRPYFWERPSHAPPDRQSSRRAGRRILARSEARKEKIL
jgi:hypothetical protein